MWGTHYLPHDAEQENLERMETRVDRLEELKLPGEIVVVERIEDVMVGVELTRKMLPTAYIDPRAARKASKASTTTASSGTRRPAAGAITRPQLGVEPG
jgi:hypothetical protein